MYEQVINMWIFLFVDQSQGGTGQGHKNSLVWQLILHNCAGRRAAHTNWLLNRIEFLAMRRVYIFFMVWFMIARHPGPAWASELEFLNDWASKMLIELFIDLSTTISRESDSNNGHISGENYFISLLFLCVSVLGVFGIPEFPPSDRPPLIFFTLSIEFYWLLKLCQNVFEIFYC